MPLVDGAAGLPLEAVAPEAVAPRQTAAMPEKSAAVPAALPRVRSDGMPTPRTLPVGRPERSATDEVPVARLDDEAVADAGVVLVPAPLALISYKAHDVPVAAPSGGPSATADATGSTTGTIAASAGPMPAQHAMIAPVAAETEASGTAPDAAAAPAQRAEAIVAPTAPTVRTAPPPLAQPPALAPALAPAGRNGAAMLRPASDPTLVDTPLLPGPQSQPIAASALPSLASAPLLPNAADGSAPAPRAEASEPAAAMVVASDRLGDVRIGIEGTAHDLRLSLGLAPAVAPLVAAEVPRLVADLAASGVRLQSLELTGAGANSAGGGTAFGHNLPQGQREAPPQATRPLAAAVLPPPPAVTAPRPRFPDRYA
ncbi:hypothetical protein F3168_01005 [Polymorphobacter fuscus]|uniref:Uncharacterized protein n=1 Tax=Sandarakinorhabdus fusca TaxID=1439888 RepID=A0A7C9KJI0_9SPHN|nr:hypothetical protein F9290_01005 [Polymorphobacter fuscus]MQT15843.1 hypothetical protein [Polymorphobacter fuscus]